jgi:CDP-diacylglycerol--glycerol-3-phosphate 3-phosphatidyltransferase
MASMSLPVPERRCPRETAMGLRRLRISPRVVSRTIASAKRRSIQSAKVFGVTLTAPNVLTFLRIATVPLLVYLLTFSGPMPSAIAAGVFFLATITDFLDGYIARSYGSGTDFGKMLDPLADKLVVTAVLIMLAAMSRIPRVPAWMVVVLVSRELLVTGLRAVVASRGHIMAAEELGKYKMALQSIALHGLLIHYTYFHIDFFAAGMFLLWIATVLTVWSGIDYFHRAWNVIRPRSRSAVARRAAN